MTEGTKPTILGLKKEFDNFRGEVKQTTDKILSVLENLSSQQPVQSSVKQEIEERAESAEDISDNGQLPPQYQVIFDKYFSKEDGFTARLNFPEVDDKGNEMGGMMFTIVVPNKFSNATQAYLDFYKCDLRSKPLQPGAVAKGIEEWCQRVSKNLNYNKLLKTK